MGCSIETFIFLPLDSWIQLNLYLEVLEMAMSSWLPKYSGLRVPTIWEVSQPVTEISLQMSVATLGYSATYLQWQAI